MVHTTVNKEKNRSKEKIALQTSGQVSLIEISFIHFDLIHISMENLLHSLSLTKKIFLNRNWYFGFPAMMNICENVRWELYLYVANNEEAA